MNADMDQDMLRMAYQRIQTMPDGPEKQQLLTRLFQDYQGMEGAIGERLNAADENAGTKMPSGVSAGRMFVASTPMHNMSAALRQGYGAYQQGQQQDKLDELAASRTEGLRGVAEMGLQGGGAPAPVSGPGGVGGGAASAPTMGDSTAYNQLFDENATDIVPSSELGFTTAAESAYNPDAVSHAGAEGLTQLMPGTAKELGVTDSFDPAQNVAGGARYLNQQRKRFGSMPLANAAYNMGPAGLQKRMDKYGATTYDEVAPYLPKETQGYVKKIRNMRNSARDKGIRVGMIPQPNEEDDMMSTALRAMGSFA